MLVHQTDPSRGRGFCLAANDNLRGTKRAHPSRGWEVPDIGILPGRQVSIFTATNSASSKPILTDCRTIISRVKIYLPTDEAFGYDKQRELGITSTCELGT